MIIFNVEKHFSFLYFRKILYTFIPIFKINFYFGNNLNKMQSDEKRKDVHQKIN